MTQKYKNIHFYTFEDAQNWLNGYMEPYNHEYGRAQGAALQYYMAQYMYLPNALIAELVSRKSWHVSQTINRMMEAAEMTRIPVTMNESYQEYIEKMDDFSREFFNAKNPELCMVLDDKVNAWIRWNAQKASGYYEDERNEPDQKEIIDEMLNVLGLPGGGWMQDIILSNFKVDYHE